MNLLDDEKIFCPICSDKKPMKQITYKHLKKHNLTISQFKDQFSIAYLIHPQLEKKIKQARIEGKKRKEKNFVKNPCWNFDNCGNNILVNINVGKKNTTCEQCRQTNLFHPDVIKNKQRLSEQVRQINQNPEIIKKRTESLNNRSIEEIEQWRNKRENTLIEKDGENWKQIQHEKTKTGMLQKYGKEYALQIDEFKNQAHTTYFINTGFLNPMYNPDIVKKVFEGREQIQNEIIKQIIETNNRLYGGNSPMNDPSIINKANKTRFLNLEERILKYLNEIGFILLTDYKNSHEKGIFKHIECGHEWETSWNNIWDRSQQGNPCPNCKPKNIIGKITQNNIQQFIESLGFNPLVDNRIFLGDGREIDFIIEEEKVCIEYCGLYWHSDEMIENTRKKINNPRTYHKSKLDICEQKGYRLITIFEDEWVEKQNITKYRLKQILNKSEAERIHARKCEIIEITSISKNEFLEQFHIQGCNDGSSLFYGAFNGEDLIAIMTFGKPRGKGKSEKNHWEIKRFCTNFNFHATGIANKILKYFMRNNNWKYIVSYADRRWSNGKLYENLGFTLKNKGVPTPWYIDINKVKRYHRSIIWKTDEEKQMNLTQEQLAVIKGYHSIHDCGHLKYVMNIPTKK